MPPPREFRDPLPHLAPAKLADPCFNTHKKQPRSVAAAVGARCDQLVPGVTSQLLPGVTSEGSEERIERAREIQRGLEKRMERRKSQYEVTVANHNQVRRSAYRLLKRNPNPCFNETKSVAGKIRFLLHV